MSRSAASRTTSLCLAGLRLFKAEAIDMLEADID